MSTFSDAVKNPRREQCAVSLNFSTDEFTDRDRALLANPDVNDSVIVKALDRKGIQTSAAAVGNHRHGECRCHPDFKPELKSDAPKRQLDRYAAKKSAKAPLITNNAQRTLSI